MTKFLVQSVNPKSYVPLRVKIELLTNSKDWEEIIRLTGYSDTISSEDTYQELTPVPKTLGCLCLAILTQASIDQENKIHLYIQQNLSLILKNLQSKDIPTVHYTFYLLYNNITYFSESIIYELLNLKVFEALFSVTTEYSLMLSHKLYKSRETAQRMFLKYKGYETIIFSLYYYKDHTKTTLLAVFDLLIVLDK